MSVERSFEAWEEVQRHGQDLADRFAQSFNGLIQSPFSAWPNSSKSKLFDLEFPSHSFGTRDFGLVTEDYAINGVSAIFDIGNRIGQVGADFGASLNGLVQQFFRSLPVPFKQEDAVMMGSVSMGGDRDRERSGVGISIREDLGSLSEMLKNHGFAENDTGAGGTVDEEVGGFNLGSIGLLGRRQVNKYLGFTVVCICCDYAF